MKHARSYHLPQIETSEAVTNLGEILLAALHADAIAEKVRVELDKILSIPAIQGSVKFIKEEKREIIKTVFDEINELIKNGELFPGGHKEHIEIKKTIRLKLAELLHEKYLIDVETSEIDESRKGPTSEEQLLRNQQLEQAIEVTKKDSSARKATLDLMEGVLALHYPPEYLNQKPIKKANLSIRQINDLITNFIFWTLEHNPRFNDFHRLIAYLYIFHGLDKTTVYDKVKQFEERDKREYGLTPETIDLSYHEIRQVFTNESDALLNRFLSEASLKDADNKSLMSNHDEYIQKITYFSETAKISPSGLRPAALHRAEIRNIDIPKTELGKTLDEIDIILLQRGNVSARNRMLLRILRLIGYLVHTGYGQYMVTRYGVPEDFRDTAQAMAEKCLEKLAMVDPQKGRISTHMNNWLKGLIQRYVYELEIVRNPAHIHALAACIKKHPDIPDEALARKFYISLFTIQKVREEYGRSNISLDAPVNPHNHKKTEFGELLDLNSSKGVEGLILTKQTRQVMDRVFALLPPRDRFILERRFREGRTFREIGGKMDVARQRVEQVEKKILSAFGGNGRPTKNFNFISDEDRFKEWCEENCPKPLEKRMMELRLGLLEENGYRALGPTQIVKYLKNKGVNGLNRKSVGKRLKALKKKLEDDQKALPEKERFVHVLSAGKCYRKARKLLGSLGEELGWQKKEIG